MLMVFLLNKIIITAFVVILEVEVKVDIVVIINRFDVFIQLRKRRFEAVDSVFGEIFQFIHKTSTFVINQFSEWFAQAVISRSDRFGLLQFNNILLRRFFGRWDLFFFDFWPLINLLISFDIGFK